MSREEYQYYEKKVRNEEEKLQLLKKATRELEYEISNQKKQLEEIKASVRRENKELDDIIAQRRSEENKYYDLVNKINKLSKVLSQKELNQQLTEQSNFDSKSFEPIFSIRDYFPDVFYMDDMLGNAEEVKPSEEDIYEFFRSYSGVGSGIDTEFYNNIPKDYKDGIFQLQTEEKIFKILEVENPHLKEWKLWLTVKNISRFVGVENNNNEELKKGVSRK